MTQPEALGYAVSLEARGFVAEASELRRLHEENEALRQALAMERFSEVNQEIEEALKQPKREWVGITYDEVYEFVCTTDSYINLAKAIEAKLKEKNT